MTTRCQLVSDHALKAWNAIMHSVGTSGGQPAIQVIESVMHDLLRADDALEHSVRDSIMRKIAPNMIKGRK